MEEVPDNTWDSLMLSCETRVELWRFYKLLVAPPGGANTVAIAMRPPALGLLFGNVSLRISIADDIAILGMLTIAPVLSDRVM